MYTIPKFRLGQSILHIKPIVMGFNDLKAKMAQERTFGKLLYDTHDMVVTVREKISENTRKELEN